MTVIYRFWNVPIRGIAQGPARIAAASTCPFDAACAFSNTTGCSLHPTLPHLMQSAHIQRHVRDEMLDGCQRATRQDQRAHSASEQEAQRDAGGETPIMQNAIAVLLPDIHLLGIRKRLIERMPGSGARRRESSVAGHSRSSPDRRHKPRPRTRSR